MRAAPMYQVVVDNRDLEWKEVDLSWCLGVISDCVRGLGSY